MATVTAVGGRNDLCATLLPDLANAVDRGRRQIGPVYEHDHSRIRFRRECTQPAPKRGAAPELPVGTVDSWGGGGHVVRA